MNIIFNPYDELDKKRKWTYESFKNYVLKGLFTSYDGDGYYATTTEISNLEINFKDIINNSIPKWCTHIVWYNK